MRLTWCDAVLRLMWSRAAISGLERPAPTSASTSCSRRVSWPPALAPGRGPARRRAGTPPHGQRRARRRVPRSQRGLGARGRAQGRGRLRGGLPRDRTGRGLARRAVGGTTTQRARRSSERGPPRCCRVRPPPGPAHCRPTRGCGCWRNRPPRRPGGLRRPPPAAHRRSRGTRRRAGTRPPHPGWAASRAALTAPRAARARRGRIALHEEQLGDGQPHVGIGLHDVDRLGQELLSHFEPALAQLKAGQSAEGSAVQPRARVLAAPHAEASSRSASAQRPFAARTLP